MENGLADWSELEEAFLAGATTDLGICFFGYMVD